MRLAPSAASVQDQGASTWSYFSYGDNSKSVMVNVPPTALVDVLALVAVMVDKTMGTSSLAPAAALPLMPLLDTLTVKSTTAPL
ncbi:hypothetical protein D3C72_1980560 [compost metagenome]